VVFSDLQQGRCVTLPVYYANQVVLVHKLLICNDTGVGRDWLDDGVRCDGEDGLEAPATQQGSSMYDVTGCDPFPIGSFLSTWGFSYFYCIEICLFPRTRTHCPML